MMLSLTLAFAAFAAPPAAPEKAGMAPEVLARIPVRMKAFVDRGNISGAVTLVQRHGAVASLEAVGYQDIEAKKPMRPDTIFQIASMTKPVTGVAIMMLMEEGKLALTDPVEKHLPEFRGLWVVEKKDDKTRVLRRPARPITVRDLMTHTSGMSGEYPEGLSDLMVKGNRTLAEAVSIFSQQPLEFEPGSKWLYSNTGLNTLGRIVEVVADMPFEKFLEARIFKPLGMKDTFFFPTPDKYDRIAVIYERKDGGLKRADIDLYRKGYKFVRASGGLYSTAQDMAAFYQAMLNGGKPLLSRASVEVMTALHTGDLPLGTSTGDGYGLTWRVTRGNGGTLAGKSIGSYGHGGAYGTQGWIDPKKDLVGVFMIQRADGGAEESTVFQELVAAAVQ
ncbi:MAG: serine hydrolase domain-containing protein [Bryobacteraceae bacterium]|nr:serine hydrolase domain-containing protein [Bryobacteraceae bacterium]